MTEQESRESLAYIVKRNAQTRAVMAKISKIIDSCRTTDQVKCARRIVNRMHRSEKLRMHYSDRILEQLELKLKCEERITIIKKRKLELFDYSYC